MPAPLNAVAIARNEFWSWFPLMCKCDLHTVQEVYSNQLYFRGYEASMYDITGYWEPFWNALMGRCGDCPLQPGATSYTSLYTNPSNNHTTPQGVVPPQSDNPFYAEVLKSPSSVGSVGEKESKEDSGWSEISSSDEDDDQWDFIPTFLSLRPILPIPPSLAHCIP